MKILVGLLCAATFVACSKSITNATKVETQSPSEVIVKAKEKFPESWFGEWTGTLEIFNAKGLSQSVPMTCLMSKTDTAGVYNWNIIYGEDRTKGLRPYLLRTIDATKGQYLCDEMNTIKMESYLIGNKLFCSYTVAGNWIMSIYEKQNDDTMVFEIIFGKEKSVSESG
ncbi:MAG: hypothetical protein JNL70_12235, partial [Saprospiraceae bacterium]|nr:hypothetical protein [Saprospiraceae bacterium]